MSHLEFQTAASADRAVCPEPVRVCRHFKVRPEPTLLSKLVLEESVLTTFFFFFFLLKPRNGAVVIKMSDFSSEI